MKCWYHWADHGQCKIRDILTVRRYRKIIEKYGSIEAVRIIREELYGKEY